MHDDPSVKNAMGTAVKNPVVELSAAAVRTRMLDIHVVVEMLSAVAYKQAVDQALSSFAGQHGMDVVPNHLASQQNRVRGNVGASMLSNLYAINVERLRMFSLAHVSGRHLAIACGSLSRTIGKP